VEEEEVAVVEEVVAVVNQLKVKMEVLVIPKRKKWNN
jgi:hypothetical protein